MLSFFNLMFGDREMERILHHDSVVDKHFPNMYKMPI